MNSVLNEKAYIDVHAWCFVPPSFRLIIHDLFCLGFIPFQEVDFFPTDGCEYYLTLGRSGSGINKSRLEMLNIIESEIKNAEPVPEEFPEAPVEKTQSFIKRLIRHFI